MELAEKELDLTLPSQYVEFLKTYGHGGICGVCTDGIGLDGSYVTTGPESKNKESIVGQNEKQKRKRSHINDS